MDIQQLVLLLVVGAISLIKWFIDRAQTVADDREARERRNDPRVPSFEPRPSVLTEEEKAARKLMEALGIPYEEAPQAPVAPPQQPLSPAWERDPEPEPYYRAIPSVPPAIEPIRTPAIERRAMAKASMASAADLAEAAETERQEEAFKEYASPFDHVQEGESHGAFEVRRKNAFRLPSLKNREELQRAILLQEILGKPKALQN